MEILSDLSFSEPEAFNSCFTDLEEHELSIIDIKLERNAFSSDERVEVPVQPEMNNFDDLLKILIDRFPELSLEEKKDRLKSKSLTSTIDEETILEEIFPEDKKVKPGKNIYSAASCFQFIIVIYIFLFFSQMSGGREELAETFRFQQFDTEMLLFMFIQIVLILLDRYFYISNTYAKMEEEKAKVTDKIRPSIIERLRVSKQKWNYMRLTIYLVLVLLIHSVVIWYLPMKGNFANNDQVYCTKDIN